MQTDNDYQVARDALIPQASSYAREKVREIGVTSKTVKGVDGKVTESDYYSVFFMDEMDRLAKKIGLIGNYPKRDDLER